MRPALMLDRPPPLPMTATRPTVVGGLRRAHLGVAAIHLVQAVLVLVIAGDVVVDVTHESGGNATRPLVGVSFGAAMAAYFACAALAHVLSASVLNAVYEADLRRGRNRIRWAEYAVTATVLMLLIALYTGVTDVTALVVVGACSAVMIACGWMQETLNPPTRTATTMVPFWAGVAAGVVPWAIIAGHLIGSPDDPQLAFPIFASLFLLWASFGVNQWLQYHQVGPWSDYLYGERTYLGLSLVAKTALAWQVVVGTTLL